jgi:hypothetical protein
MKKIFVWFLNHLFEIIVLFIIIVIVLYIIYFAESISDKAEKIITAFAATATSFFLFLAFLQSKKSNELTINKPKFDYLENEVNEVLKKGDEEVLSQERIEYLVKVTKFPEPFLHLIIFNVFDNHLTAVLKFIKSNTNYQTYFDLLGQNVKVSLKDKPLLHDDANELSLVFQIIRACTLEIYLYYNSIYTTCKRIHTSLLEKKHREILIEKLL